MQQLIFEIEKEIASLQKKLNSTGQRTEKFKKLAEDLRGGRKITDCQFDQVYHPAIRELSATHWTPVEVAIRAAELLAENGKARVLDVGSGAGKFCTVAALSSKGLFFGIEQRPHLVEVARTVAEEMGATRATFYEGNMTDLDWSFFDSFYLFNPFYENVMREIRIDETISLNQDKFSRYVETVRTKLRAARPGTMVATYHGFGGEVPLGYQLSKKERVGSSCLELWVKVDTPRSILKRTNESIPDIV